MAVEGADLQGYYFLMIIGLLGMILVLSYVLIKILLYLNKKRAQSEENDDLEL